MNHYELFLYWLTAGLQVVLCGLIYVRNIERRLPFFAAYATLLVTGTLGIQLVYLHFGFRSATAYYSAWVAATAYIIARSFAIAELCRYEFRAYRGIWALTWRVLALLAVFFLGHAALDALGQPDRIAIYGLALERDFGISSVVILLAMLLIRSYYGISLEPPQKWIAVGMCFYCTIDVVNNTMLRDAFVGHLFSWFYTKYMFSWPEMRSQVEHANEWWNTVRASGFIVSMSIWCLALRKPLPAPSKDPVLLPVEVYREVSPAVNLRLRAFNDRLLELLKP